MIQLWLLNRGVTNRSEGQGITVWSSEICSWLESSELLRRRVCVPPSSIVLYWPTFKIPHRKLSGTFFHGVVTFFGFPFIPGYFVSYSTLQLCLHSVCLGGPTFDVCQLETDNYDGGSECILKGTNCAVFSIRITVTFSFVWTSG
jgi:hypothetical protein